MVYRVRPPAIPWISFGAGRRRLGLAADKSRTGLDMGILEA